MTAYLLWYVQYPGQGLQLLLGYYSRSTVVHGLRGFEAEFSKCDSSFHLKKASVHLSDSAVYFCAVSEAVGGAEHKHPWLCSAQTQGHSLSS